MSHELINVEAGDGIWWLILLKGVIKLFHDKKLNENTRTFQVGTFSLVQLCSLKLSLWRFLTLFLLHLQDGPQNAWLLPLQLWHQVDRIPFSCWPLWGRDKVGLLQTTGPNSEGNTSSPVITGCILCSSFMLRVSSSFSLLLKGWHEVGPEVSASPGNLLEMQNPGPTLDLLNWNLHSTKIPRGSSDTLNCVKSWSKAALL